MIPRGVAVALSALAVACSPASSDRPPDATASAPVPAAPNRADAHAPDTARPSVRYTLTWSWEGATWDADTRRYVVITSDGRVVTFSKLAVALSMVGVLPCDAADAGSDSGTTVGSTFGAAPVGRRRAPILPRMVGALWKLNPLASSVAQAGHTFIPTDAFVITPVIEAALAAGPLPAGERPTEGERFCRVYHQYEAVDADPAAAVYRQSLHAVGTYQPSASEPARPFDVATALPVGALVSLDAASDASALDVTLERRPARAAATVDWTVTGPDLPFALLRALATTSRVSAGARP